MHEESKTNTLKQFAMILFYIQTDEIEIEEFEIEEPDIFWNHRIIIMCVRDVRVCNFLVDTQKKSESMRPSDIY